MFQRVLDLKILLSTALAETNCNEYLTNNDWIIITKACELLKPFKENTTEISSEKSVTISKIVVLSKSLIKYCNKIKSDHNTNMQISKLIDVLVSEVDTRFRSLELNPLYAESTILDPRFKNCGFLHQYVISEDKKFLINKAATVNIVNNIQEVTALPNQTDDDSIWNDFDSEVGSIVQSSNPTAAFIVELDKYLNEPLLSWREHPLLWWNLNQYVYPRIFKFVKKRFCIMGTSVPGERIFFQSWTDNHKKNK